MVKKIIQVINKPDGRYASTGYRRSSHFGKDAFQKNGSFFKKMVFFSP